VTDRSPAGPAVTAPAPAVCWVDRAKAGDNLRSVFGLFGGWSAGVSAGSAPSEG